MFIKINKSESYCPGFICVLHTFGRDLKWNPHIHCLISEGAIGKSGLWKNIRYFPYKYLRDAFQTVLLKLLSKKLGDDFKRVKSAIYKNHKNGFYVYAKPTDLKPREAIKYIGRYLGRPVIAASRIDSYDGDAVVFHYNRHEDDVYVQEKVPALEFIERLIQHIPDRNFKMVRYYGIYASRKQSYPVIRRAISREKTSFYHSQNHWRNMILMSFGVDSLKCPHCGKEMLFQDLIINHKRVPLDEMYKQVVHSGIPPNKLCSKYRSLMV